MNIFNYLWYPQQESNLHLPLRRGLFYPLNYKDESSLSDYTFPNQIIVVMMSNTNRNHIMIAFVCFSYLSFLASSVFSCLRSATSLLRKVLDSSRRNCDFLKSISVTEFFATSSALQSLSASSWIVLSFFFISSLRSI